MQKDRKCWKHAEVSIIISLHHLKIHLKFSVNLNVIKEFLSQQDFFQNHYTHKVQQELEVPQPRGCSSATGRSLQDLGLPYHASQFSWSESK